ncbi:MAG: DMT family transporter [Clostridia bacterium]|nr:DMT family transporter [Clostridia bacterium]
MTGHSIKRQGRATFLIVASAVCWSFAGLLSKFTPWNALSLVGFRALLAVLLLGWARRSFRPVHTAGNWLGALGVVSTAVLFIFANKLTSAANAIVLQYAMPAVVVVLQAILFRVTPTKTDIIATLLVMVGVLLCFYQGLGGGGLVGDLLSLSSSVTWALVFLAARMPNADAVSYTYMGNLLGCGFLVSIFFDPGIETGGTVGWLVAVAMGLCLGIGYLCFGKGLSTGLSLTVAAVVANVEPILNPTWVFLFMGENPGTLAIVGSVIVLAAATWHSMKQRPSAAIDKQSRLS